MGGVTGGDTQGRTVPSGTLHLWPDGALFEAADLENAPHRHFTASILVGLGGPIRVRAKPLGDWQVVDATLVAPNVEQQLDARGARLATLQVDPECEAFGAIAHRLTSGAVVLPPDLAARVQRELSGLDGSHTAATRARAATLALLAEGGAPLPPRDPRIVRVLERVKEDFLAPPPAAVLARDVGLSAGRLIHLFTREMGLPLRRYVLWLRLRDVVLSIATGATLTEAAHGAGFADSPHLSRTFRGMFGFPPSFIADARGRVKVTFDAEQAQLAPAPHPPLDPARVARALGAGRRPPRAPAG